MARKTLATSLLPTLTSPFSPFSASTHSAVDVTKPCEFIGFGAMDVTKPYEFIGFEAMDVTKPYEFIRFGAMDDPLIAPLRIK